MTKTWAQLNREAREQGHPGDPFLDIGETSPLWASGGTYRARSPEPDISWAEQVSKYGAYSGTFDGWLDTMS